MNCVQQRIKPGYGIHYLESIADFILIPARWMWEEKSVTWIRANDKKELRPVYSSNENRMGNCCMDFGGASIAILIIGGGYAATSILLSPLLGLGLALKSLSFELSPKSKEYNALVVEHLIKCDDMSEIEEHLRDSWFFSPGDSAELRRSKIHNLETLIRNLEDQKKMLFNPEEDIQINAKNESQISNIASLERKIRRLNKQKDKIKHQIDNFKRMPQDFILDVQRLMEERSPLIEINVVDYKEDI